jgi:hypothetical protein
MTTSPTPAALPESGFVCRCEEKARSACRGESCYGEADGKKYCVLHFPGDGKTAEFKKALLRKRNHDFRGVVFPKDPNVSNFSDVTFDTHANFSKATFPVAAYFNRAKFFKGATFEQARFEGGVNFTGATFNEKKPNSSREEEANFRHARFYGEVDFTDAIFEVPVTFFSATFKNRVRFCGREGQRTFGGTLDLQNARIEQPERFSFRDLTLRPTWFVLVDPRTFEFANITWEFPRFKDMERDLETRKVSAPLRKLEKAFRQLAFNAEQNDEYRDASRFRYRATTAHRRGSWRWFEPPVLNWLYWLGSGYGERVWQAILVFFSILLLFAAFYTRVKFATSEPRTTSQNTEVAKPDKSVAPLEPKDAFVYSAAVLTLQKPEPHPVTPLGKGLVTVEGILGPVQAALLALAIRRKFMR